MQLQFVKNPLIGSVLFGSIWEGKENREMLKIKL